MKFSANGASQLISASGWSLRARELAKDEGLSDRGVAQTVGGTPRTQGTLALACESWGVGSNTTALTAGTYAVDLVVVLPIAEDPFDLTGAIFLQSATADLTVEINWAQTADLFAVNTGNVAFSGNCQVLTVKQNIPVSNGAIIVPDLSMFHSYVESQEVALQNGENEVRITGQGAGKAVLRIIYRLENGNPSAPVPMTAANFGLQAWRYGTATWWTWSSTGASTPTRTAPYRCTRRWPSTRPRTSCGYRCCAVVGWSWRPPATWTWPCCAGWSASTASPGCG